MKISKEKQLMKICKKFIDDNKISCTENIYQCDNVIENAYDFINQICDVVGYYQYLDNE